MSIWIWYPDSGLVALIIMQSFWWPQIYQIEFGSVRISAWCNMSSVLPCSDSQTQFTLLSLWGPRRWSQLRLLSSIVSLCRLTRGHWNLDDEVRSNYAPSAWPRLTPFGFGQTETPSNWRPNPLSRFYDTWSSLEPLETKTNFSSYTQFIWACHLSGNESSSSFGIVEKIVTPSEKFTPQNYKS